MKRTASGHFAMRRLFRFFESSGSESSSESDTDGPAGADGASPARATASGRADERAHGMADDGGSDAERLSLDRELPGVAAGSVADGSQVTRGSDPYWSDLDDLEPEQQPHVANALRGAGTFHQYMSNFELHEMAAGAPGSGELAAGGGLRARGDSAGAADARITVGRSKQTGSVSRTHSDSHLERCGGSASVGTESGSRARSGAGSPKRDENFTFDFSGRLDESKDLLVGKEKRGSLGTGGEFEVKSLSGQKPKVSDTSKVEKTATGEGGGGGGGTSGLGGDVNQIYKTDFGVGLAHELKLMHFKPDGSHELRSLSRKRILTEARDSMPTHSINRRVVAQLLQRSLPQRTHNDVSSDFESEERGVKFKAEAADGSDSKISRAGGKVKSDARADGLGLDGGENAEDVAKVLKTLGISGGKKARSRALRQYLRNELQPRDIRQVDPAFSAKPALWVRHSALVVSLQGVRALICHDKMFLFDPDEPRVRKAAKIVEHRLRTDPNVDDVFMPFEFKALEGILIATVMQLEREFAVLEPAFKESLSADWSGNRLTTTTLEQLRLNKQRLSYFQKQAASVQHALQDVLDEDEDMANMYLTEKCRQQEAASDKKATRIGRDPLDHDEIEVLLEAYMQVINDLCSKAELLDEAIEDTEDLVGIHLDTLRNRLIMFQLVLSIVGMTFSFGGMVAGFFGMNLPIPIYEASGSEWWFLGVTVVIVVVIVVVSTLMVTFLKWQGLYSSALAIK